MSRDRTSSPSTPIELVTLSGLRLRVPADFDEAHLRRLLGVTGGVLTFPPSPSVRTFVGRSPVDMRKGFDDLSAQVIDVVDEDPQSVVVRRLALPSWDFPKATALANPTATLSAVPTQPRPGSSSRS